jgi:hypothetical protein
MRYLTLLICLYAAPLAAAPRPELRLPAGLVISSITIETHNVFDPAIPAENKYIFRTADHIHSVTREPVIMRELLFEVGDRYNAALAAETERNLRALPFIRRAEVAPTVNGNGTVDVLVRTYDSWTLQLVANYKRAGGATSMKAGIAEDNIMGQGKAGSAVYNNDWGKASADLTYKDRQFLHYKRMQYTMAAHTGPNSKALSLSLDRPFYASIARTAMGGSASYSEAPSGAVSRRVAQAGLTYGFSMKPSTERTRRFNFGLLARRAESTGPVPDKDRALIFQIGGEFEELDYLTVRRIQKFTHDEDYNLGFGIIPVIGLAPVIKSLGTPQTQILPSVAAHKGFTWGNQLLLLTGNYSSKYINGRNSMLIASLNANYYLRGIKYQTLAVHVGWDLGWRLDPALPLTLGEFNGLRGYGVDQFTGTRRFLLNLEDRLYVWDDLFRLLDVGVVFFYDSGYVWPQGRPVKLGDLQNSAGIGLRLAPSRSADNRPVHIDLARALNGNRSRPSWSLSILGGQAF